LDSYGAQEGRAGEHVNRLYRQKEGDVMAMATHGSRPGGGLPSRILFFFVVVVHELVVVGLVVIFV
jgi:hypothetical protein